MPVLDVYDIEKNKISEINLSDAVFGTEVNESAIHEIVRYQLATRRQGTASTKERSEIRGGGKKPWRQKGTGRARAGSNRSPLWRGGGTIFGPKPRDYSYAVPKKLKKTALKSALSMKCQEQKVIILQEFPATEIKTKRFKEVLTRFGLTSALFVLDRSNDILERSSRNLREVKTMRSDGINVYDILKYEHLVMLEPAAKNIEGKLLA